MHLDVDPTETERFVVLSTIFLILMWTKDRCESRVETILLNCFFPHNHCRDQSVVQLAGSRHEVINEKYFHSFKHQPTSCLSSLLTVIDRCFDSEVFDCFRIDRSSFQIQFSQQLQSLIFYNENCRTLSGKFWSSRRTGSSNAIISYTQRFTVQGFYPIAVVQTIGPTSDVWPNLQFTRDHCFGKFDT